MDIAVGFVIGVALVAPIGPVSLLLLGIGLERGRTTGLWAGLGVAGADIVLLTGVFVLSEWLSKLDPGNQRIVDVSIGVTLVAIGLHGLACRRGVAAVVERIRHPARALAVATAANPLTIAVWLGLVVSVSGEHTGWALARLWLGVALATTVWHVSLGVAAGALGDRVGHRSRLALQRGSGVVMAAMGVGLVW